MYFETPGHKFLNMAQVIKADFTFDDGGDAKKALLFFSNDRNIEYTGETAARIYEWVSDNS